MKKKTEENKKSGMKITMVDDIFGVARVNNYSDDLTFFTLVIKVNDQISASIDGCKVISKDDRDFIGFPSKKVEDKYYNIAYVNLSDDIQSKIIDKIAELI